MNPFSQNISKDPTSLALTSVIVTRLKNAFLFTWLNHEFVAGIGVDTDYYSKNRGIHPPQGGKQIPYNMSSSDFLGINCLLIRWTSGGYVNTRRIVFDFAIIQRSNAPYGIYSGLEFEGENICNVDLGAAPFPPPLPNR